MVDEFTLIKCIGKGAFGEVYLSSKQGSTQLFATKKVPKAKADSPAIKKYFINEITILREISHPYIIHFETIKHTIHNYYIITEYCNGGDLLSCLKKYKNLYYYPFSEEIVQHLMRQIVSAIKYLHSKRIIHRDLKLENILVNFENDNDKANVNMLKAKIKIIDFGFATHLGASNLRYSTLGSPINMDPILLQKLVNKNKGVSNLIGYDEKADIWSLGTVCYELLIGHEVFNAQTMVDLIKKVERGNYHVPTHLSKEVVSFLNGMLQYSAKRRLSAEELSKHAFLTKNVKDFKKLDLRKVSHKVDNQGLNINIKRNQSIWAIFNEEDEKTLIDIPGNYLGEGPIQELEELLGIKDIVSNNNKHVEQNPFSKPININININNKMNNNANTNQTNIVKNKEAQIDYDLLKKQQKMYREINLKNDKYKRYANYVHNNPYGFGGTNNYNNNYYVNSQTKYYTANLNNVNNNTDIQNNKNAINNINTNTNLTNQNSQNNKENKILIQYPQYQYPNQYPYTAQPPYYQTNIQNIKKAPVKSQQDLINQGFYQTSPNTKIPENNNNINEPSNNYSKNNNQIQKPLQSMQVQNPVMLPSNSVRNKTPTNQINTSKISAVTNITNITNITTKTVKLPKGTRIPKSYYDYYNNQNTQQITANIPHSKSPIRPNDINNKNIIYQKQATFNDKPKDNYYINNNQNINNINANNVNNINTINKKGNKNLGHTITYKTPKDIKSKDEYFNMKNDIKSLTDKTVTITINNNKEKKGSETYTIKYENKNFPEVKEFSPNIKVTKLNEPIDGSPIPLDFDINVNHKKSADYKEQNNPTEKEENKILNIDKKEKEKYKRNDSFPMPESEEEKSKGSNNDDDSDNLDELIDFKLGEEVCPEPEDAKYSGELNDDNNKEKEDDFEMTMKKKIMERTVERPTIGVPPPGTDPKDNFNFDEDEGDNNGVFQTNKNNFFNNDNYNFEI